MLSNKEIITKYEHNDVEQEKFFKSYHNIYNIYTIYSPDIETGEMKFTLQMKTIYSYLLSWQENGLTCYQNQEDLAKMCDMSRQRFVEMTSKMQKAGILKKEKIEGRRNKELIALPITDSHLNPPESIHASPAEDVKPISNAIPQTKSEEPTQSDTTSTIKSFDSWYVEILDDYPLGCSESSFIDIAMSYHTKSDYSAAYSEACRLEEYILKN
ncbi:hypothetical protein CF038_22680 [Klebsiella michiganensis]|nr:helix-turn-helix domain-containing protein [Klebsiella michiganensis]MBW5995413.1 hypothetical protein [Klebsiella michiganensis]